MAKLTDKQQKAFDELRDAVAHCLAHGMKRKRVLKLLTRKGISEKWANNYIDKVEQFLHNTPEGRKILAHRYKIQMLWDGSWWIASAAIALYVYHTHSPATSYIASAVAFACGAIKLYFSFGNWRRSKEITNDI
jgi:hypothetical protein